MNLPMSDVAEMGARATGLGFSVPPIPPSVLAAATHWDVPAGRFLQVSAGDVCYGVRTGMVKLTCSSYRNDGALVDVLEPGQWFGVVDLFATGRCGFSAETASPCSLFVIRKARVQQLLECDPEVQRWLLCASAARVHRIAERHQVLTSSTPEERVHWAIHMLAERFGYFRQGCRIVGVRMSQSQVACVANTSRQTVNKVMMKMKLQRQLEVVNDRMVLPLNRDEGC